MSKRQQALRYKRGLWRPKLWVDNKMNDAIVFLDKSQMDFILLEFLFHGYLQEYVMSKKVRHK